MSLHVELKILDPRVREWSLGYKSEMAAGIDLFAATDGEIILRPQAVPVMIPTGIAIYIGDPNFMSMVTPRSGLGTKGLVMANTVGVIDADYQGQMMVAAWNRNPSPYALDQFGLVIEGKDALIRIKPGDRIAQMIFLPIARARFAVVDEFSNKTDRGAGGWGSTGVAA